jgi:hypothetical protein
MSHGLTDKDAIFSVRERPWHGLGVVLDGRRARSTRRSRSRVPANELGDKARPELERMGARSGDEIGLYHQRARARE